MKKFPIPFFVILVLLFIASCKKKTEVIPPVIEVIKPIENEQYVLPASIPVQLHIASEQPIIYLKIGIENENQVLISPPVFLHPEANQSDFNLNLQIDKLSENQRGPFYLHVKAENEGGLSHEFVQLQLENPNLVSKGFFLVLRQGIQQTKVLYYDSLFVARDFLFLPNEFNDAAVSCTDDMFFVSIKSPDQLQAFRFENSELAWKKEAQMPIPTFYKLKLTSPLIYTGTGNGRIWGFRADNGNEQFISELIYDSVPGQIGVFEDYVVADYQSLTGSDRGWLVFQKQTAALLHQHSTQLAVQAFYPTLIKNQALAFGNIGSLGVIQFYEIENNKVLFSLNFATGVIVASCQMGTGFFLIAVGKDIWQFNEQQRSFQLLLQAAEDVVDLQYDIVSKNIYVAQEQRLSVFNATGDTLINETLLPAPIRAVCLRLGYE